MLCQLSQCFAPCSFLSLHHTADTRAWHLLFVAPRAPQLSETHPQFVEGLQQTWYLEKPSPAVPFPVKAAQEIPVCSWSRKLLVSSSWHGGTAAPRHPCKYSHWGWRWSGGGRTYEMRMSLQRGDTAVTIMAAPQDRRVSTCLDLIALSNLDISILSFT